MRLVGRLLVVGVLLMAFAFGSLGGPVAGQEPTTTSATPTETSGVVSERGLASGAVAVVLVGGTLLVLWRRRRTTE